MKVSKYAFKDTSLFQRIFEYKDEKGKDWRVIDNGVFYDFYSGLGNAFHYDGHLEKQEFGSIEKMHGAYVYSGFDLEEIKE